MFVPILSFGFVYLILCVLYQGSLNSDTPTLFLVGFTYAEAGSTVLVFFFQNRLNQLLLKRTEALQIRINQQKVELEIKRNFIRFISHEVRTPLNVALMGVEYLEGCSEYVQKAFKEKYMTTLSELKDSCKSSVDILNDVLNFDKLSNGAMILNLTRIKAITMIETAVRAFNTMVRENYIYMILLHVR